MQRLLQRFLSRKIPIHRDEIAIRCFLAKSIVSGGIGDLFDSAAENLSSREHVFAVDGGCSGQGTSAGCVRRESQLRSGLRTAEGEAILQTYRVPLRFDYRLVVPLIEDLSVLETYRSHHGRVAEPWPQGRHKRRPDKFAARA